MVAVFALVLICLAIGLFFVPGVGPFLAVAAGIGAVIALVWAVGVFSSGRTPAGVARESGRRKDKPELLGPGGADDPDRAR